MLTAADLNARILYRDPHLIILNKPAGLPVHAGPKTRADLESLLPLLAGPRGEVPQLAHRLDQDTAGCLLLARNERALRQLSRLFSAGNIKKTYWAVVAGVIAEDHGTIDLPLRKISSKAAGWRMVPQPPATGPASPATAADAANKPQTATTLWRCRGRSGQFSWLELSPLTGRTHQIRVHCASGLGAAILGDPVYAPAGHDGRMLHLLAQTISLPWGAAGEQLTISAPPPPHMQQALQLCGWGG